MPLTGSQYKLIQEALLSAYNDSTLEQMLRFNMNERFDLIVGEGNFTERVFELIGWAEQSGRERELLDAAHSSNPGNRLLASVWQGMVEKLESPKPAGPSESPTMTGGGVETTASRHTVILFLPANPRSTAFIDLQDEIRSVKQRLRAATFGGRIDVEWEWAVRRRDLDTELMWYKPNVVHFSSHGTKQEELLLQGDNNQIEPLKKEALVNLIAILKDNIKLVFLNACHSKEHAEALIEHIPCAIGMGEAISIKAAILFSEHFYNAIGFNRSIREAFDLGVEVLRREGVPEDNTPVLKMQLGKENLKLLAD